LYRKITHTIDIFQYGGSVLNESSVFYQPFHTLSRRFLRMKISYRLAS